MKKIPLLPKQITTQFMILLIIGIFVTAGIIALIVTRAATPFITAEADSGTIKAPAAMINDSAASGGKAVQFKTAAAGCQVDELLVNSCGPWLAAFSNNYPEVASGLRNQITAHEQRIGRQLDVVHDYRPVGSNTLSADEKYYAARAGTILSITWKPAGTWKDAAGGNASVNAGIDSMAASVKSIAPHKIFFSVFHEPENDVSPGGSPGCGSSVTYKGSAGTTADYVNMWHNVRSRFDAAGVTNVVWTINYMGFSTWNCMIKDLWPGNSYVDWITWDPYVTSNSGNYNSSVGSLYNFLSSNSDSSHNFNSKPWGLNEWETFDSVDQAHTIKTYQDAKTALDNNTFPKIKLYTVFDALNSRTLYAGDVNSTTKDQSEQNAYNSFANDPIFKEQ
jgi:hypothetical protein